MRVNRTALFFLSCFSFVLFFFYILFSWFCQFFYPGFYPPTQRNKNGKPRCYNRSALPILNSRSHVEEKKKFSQCIFFSSLKHNLDSKQFSRVEKMWKKKKNGVSEAQLVKYIASVGREEKFPPHPWGGSSLFPPARVFLGRGSSSAATKQASLYLLQHDKSNSAALAAILV